MSGFSYRWCLNEPDYYLVMGWLKSWKFEPLPRQYYSEYGAIVSKGGEDVCCGWLYQSDSKIAWIEWVVINKKASKKNREGAIDFLYETLFNKGKELGFELVMTYTKKGRFCNYLEDKHGFTPTGETNMELLFKKL